MWLLRSLFTTVLTGVANVSESQDLFSERWTEGNLHNISWLVDNLGGFCCTVISVVGFGIVIFSILKNALSGLYVVNPTFWDKVDDIKTQAVGGIQSTIQGAAGGNQVTAKLGGVVSFLLGLLPNVKDLTDFATGKDGNQDPSTIDKKQYFTKSLLMLIAQIFIGMLIFFGYPSKIANWIGTGATYAIGVVLENANPVEFVSGFADSFVSVNLSTDNSPIKLEQNINEAARDAIAAVKTKYGDIKKESVQTVGGEIESYLIGALPDSDVGDILGAQEGYDYSIDCAIMENIPTKSSAFSPVGAAANNVYMAIGTNGTRTYRLWKSVNDLSHGSQLVGASDYIVWTINAVPEAVSSIASTRAVIFGGFGTGTVSGTSVKVPVNGIIFGDSDGEVQGTPGNTVSITAYKDATGADPKTVKGKLEAPLGSIAQTGFTLIVSKGDYEAVKDYEVWDVGLTGNWTMGNTANNKTTTYTLTKFRLKKNATTSGAALTSWASYVDLPEADGSMTVTSSISTSGLINADGSSIN